MRDPSESKAPTVRAGDLRSPTLGSLNLKLVAGHQGLDRPVDWPRVQKPGLAIAGFLDYVKENRVQILGASEYNYLKTLPAAVVRERLDAFTKLPLAAVVVTKGIHPGSVLTGFCRRRHVPLFTTERLTSVVIEGLTAFLEESLAPRATLHGVLMEVGGLGTLLLGDSGVGKSECALALVQRGHRLVADDLVVVQRFPNDVLIGSSSGLIRHHMELRGLGIVNVPMLFGVAAVLERHTVEFVIQLEDWGENTAIDRLGLDDEFQEILGVRVPLVRMPVATGRDVALLVEIAARNQLLKRRGFNAAREIAQKVHDEIVRKAAADHVARRAKRKLTVRERER
ncbi:MAG: HPr(Ser) kinase/phosphatase [Thermoanaerobaculia bacterium]|jgi:HPr kinase/phosphorylase